MNTYADITAGLAAGLWPDAPAGKRPLFMWGEPGAEHLTDSVPDDAIEVEIEKYLTEVEKWRAMGDLDTVIESFRIRNPYGEEQTITDRHTGLRASFDDGDTWTVSAMVAAGWETTDAPEWSDPETVTVAVYERRRLPKNFEHPESVVEHVLNQLEEYGDPDLSAAEEMTPAMVEAARVFLAVVRKEFQVWACDEVEEFEIDVADWRKSTGR